MKLTIRTLFVLIFYFISISCFGSIYANKYGIQKSISITIETRTLSNVNDAIALRLENAFYQFGKRSMYVKDKHDYRSLNQKVVNKKVKFQIPISEPTFLALNSSIKDDFWFGFSVYVVPGDQVKISEIGGLLKFSGKSANKFRCAYDLENIIRPYRGRMYPGPSDTSKIENYYHMIDSLGLKALKTLKSYKTIIDQVSYSLLKADLITYYEGTKMHYLTGNFGRDFYYYLPNSTFNLSKRFVSYLNNYNDPLWSEQVESEFLNNESIRHWRYFSTGILFDSFLFRQCLLRGDFSISLYCRFIREKLSGTDKEWALSQVLLDPILVMRYPNHEEIHQNILSALKWDMKNPLVIDSLKSVIPSVSVGIEAYNFRLSDCTGKMINLSDFRGKVILLDFWFFGCGNCIRIHPLLDSIGKLFNPEKFQVVSICFDKNRNKSKWLFPNPERNQYTSDANVNLWVQTENVTGNHRPEVLKKFNVYAGPTLVMIDKDGRLMNTVKIGDKGSELIEMINSELNR